MNRREQMNFGPRTIRRSADSAQSDSPTERCKSFFFSGTERGHHSKRMIINTLAAHQRRAEGRQKLKKKKFVARRSENWFSSAGSRVVFELLNFFVGAILSGAALWLPVPMRTDQCDDVETWQQQRRRRGVPHSHFCVTSIGLFSGGMNGTLRQLWLPEEEEKTSAKMRASPITTGLENEIPPQKPLSSTLTRTHRHTHTHTHTRCVLSESLDTYNGTVSSLVLIIIGLFIHFRRIFLLKRSPTDSHVVHFTKDRRCVDVTDQLKSTFNDLPAPPSFHYANSRILFPLKVKCFNLNSKEKSTRATSIPP